MARLTARQRRAAARQLQTRIRLEGYLERGVRTIFRKYVREITGYAAATGLFHFPKKLESEIRDELRKHYRRCARKFANFSRSLNEEKWFNVQIDRKVWQPFLQTKASGDYASRIDSRIRTRVLELFDNVSTEKAARIAETTSQEIQRYIDTISSKATAEGLAISRQDLAKEVRNIYIKRSDSRSKAIAITETTYAVETTKEVELEEVLDELDEDQLAELAETNDEAALLLADLEDVLDEMSGIDGITDDDILEAGGLAALIAGLTITKTWVATLDSATREAHADADGQEVFLTDTFNVDGEDLLYPGDPDGSPENVINCRCSVIYGI